MENAITDRQLEIIEAAGKILTTAGVSGLTTKNLAKEMNFSEGAIYRHFAGKEQIVVALLEYLAEQIDEVNVQAVSHRDSPQDKFQSLFQAQIAFFKENPHFVVAVFSAGLLEESKQINETIYKIMQVMMKHLMPIIMAGQQQNVFTNKITTEELLNIVMGTFRLQMFKWRISGFQFDIERSGYNMIESLLTLIKSSS
ncbi:TetR/AcrR family transcriptional regulator [Membranihabitans marinus]|nr:TetR/AcrR family transcriptional regulator [Membranihabitans marinus]